MRPGGGRVTSNPNGKSVKVEPLAIFGFALQMDSFCYPKRRWADTSLPELHLGWSPHVTLEGSMSETIAHIRAELTS
jgi:hypothetical protein